MCNNNINICLRMMVGCCKNVFQITIVLLTSVVVVLLGGEDDKIGVHSTSRSLEAVNSVQREWTGSELLMRPDM